MGVSAIVLTLNEEKDIGYCLKSLQWCDEVVVVDSFSEDSTVEIAEEHGAEVYQKEVEGNSFDQLRSFGLEKASNEWVFVLDADEVCPKPLADRLLEIKEEGEFDAVKIPRKNYNTGKWAYFGLWPDYQRRFFRKKYVDYKDELHSALKVDDEAKLKELEVDEDYAIRHFTSTGIHDRMDKINKFTTINARSSDENFRLLKPLFDSLVGFTKNLGKMAIYKKGYARGYELFVEACYAPISIMLTEFKKWQIQERGTEEEIYEVYNKKREEVLKEYD